MVTTFFCGNRREIVAELPYFFHVVLKHMFCIKFQPMPKQGALVPDSTATYQLFDRVVNVREGFSVPFGLRGTVVGIHTAEVEVNTMYEVLFDEEFVGGISVR